MWAPCATASSSSPAIAASLRRRCAGAAEERGFDTFYVPEHTHIPVTPRCGPPRDRRRVPARRPLPPHPRPVGHAGDRRGTSPRRIRLSTAVAPAGRVTTRSRSPRRSPRSTTSPAAASPSAPASAGTPTSSPTTTSRPAGAARSFAEYVEAMRALWTEEEAAYDGEFVSFGPSWAYPKPVQPHVPLLIGAGGRAEDHRLDRGPRGRLDDHAADVRRTRQIAALLPGLGGRRAARASPQIHVLIARQALPPRTSPLWADAGVDRAHLGCPRRRRGHRGGLARQARVAPALTLVEQRRSGGRGGGRLSPVSPVAGSAGQIHAQPRHRRHELRTRSEAALVSTRRWRACSPAASSARLLNQRLRQARVTSTETSRASAYDTLVASVSCASRASWVRAAASTSAGPLTRQRDPVADVETGVAAGLLDGADQVAGDALGLELGGERGVEHDEAATRQARRSRCPRRCRRRPSPAGTPPRRARARQRSRCRRRPRSSRRTSSP